MTEVDSAKPKGSRPTSKDRSLARAPKRVFARCVDGQWKVEIKLEPGEYITPSDVRRLKRSINLAYRLYRRNELYPETKGKVDDG